MARTHVWILAIGCVVAGGCSQNHYQVRMTPTDSGFDRELTCWTENTGEPREPRAMSSEELAKIEACYGSSPRSEEEGRSVFHGKFTVETPQDLGGAGRLERIETSLGTLWVYVERFRGNDDLESELTKRREAVDTLVDLILGWLRKEFGEEAKFERLEGFVNGNLRRDLKNLAVYLWAAEANSQGEMETNGTIERLWLFGRERDYLTLHDVAAIMRSQETSDPALVLEIVARLVARELEVDPTSGTLSIFRAPQRLESSWSDHIRGSDYYAECVRKEQEKSAKADKDKSPTPGEAVIELLLEAFIHFDLASDDMLEVTLDAAMKPISTNGIWNEAEKTVTWNESMWARPALPTVCSATWAVPDTKEQRKRFGDVVLTAQDLAGYAMWHESLSEQEAEQWEKVLAECHGGESWQETVKTFQFDEKTPAKELLAGQVKGLLIEEEE